MFQSREDLLKLLPRDKIHTRSAQKLVELGFPAVEPVLSEILEWVQDGNWPVAQIFLPFLADVGLPLAPHIQRILSTDDAGWKYFILFCVVGESDELRRQLKSDLERLASSPTADERSWGTDKIARELLIDHPS